MLILLECYKRLLAFAIFFCKFFFSNILKTMSHRCRNVHRRGSLRLRIYRYDGSTKFFDLHEKAVFNLNFVLIFSCLNILIASGVYRLRFHFMKSSNEKLFKIRYLSIYGNFSYDKFLGSVFFNWNCLQIAITLIFIVYKSILKRKLLKIEFFFYSEKISSVFNEGNCFGNWIRLSVYL